jgi:DNA-binding NarL/FixJ family response regulator
MNAMEQENVLEIARREPAAFKVAIVGRDSLTSGLLAEALVHNLKCDAVPLQRSDLLRVLGTNRFALVIISADLNSVTGAGVDLARDVSSAHPDAPIIILMEGPVDDQVIQAFRSGARGVFNPQDSMSEFIDCVEHVKKGYIWAGKQVTDYFLDAFRHAPALSTLNKDNLSALTMRESQVVQCAARGMTNRAISADLRLSEHTVKNYLFKAFEKLGVSSRVELLFYLSARGHSVGQSNVVLEDDLEV